MCLIRTQVCSWAERSYGWAESYYTPSLISFLVFPFFAFSISYLSPSIRNSISLRLTIIVLLFFRLHFSLFPEAFQKNSITRSSSSRLDIIIIIIYPHIINQHSHRHHHRESSPVISGAYPPPTPPYSGEYLFVFVFFLPRASSSRCYSPFLFHRILSAVRFLLTVSALFAIELSPCSPLCISGL
ncbi:hypothetical protein RND81_11G055800 [Saponaria officinalis]|uniref:Uncharacterized protein n=1 Tax=Saponaria officinalis TaxID=3572 RepID=A0AAW1HJW2_SAPOF